MTKMLLSNGRSPLLWIAFGVLVCAGARADASADPWIWQNPLPQGNTLQGVACPSATSCKAVGAVGTILSWDGSDWTIDANPSADHLNAVSCASTTSCKAVGSNGVVLSWDGTDWTAEASGTAHHLNSVSCASPSMCKAVGGNGTILSWDGATWSAETSGTSFPLTGVACPTTGFCKAVGHDIFVTSGLALHWNGTGWSADTLPVDTNQLFEVSCSATNHCKAAGLFGAIVTWNGATWTADTTGFATLRGIACTSPSQCKVVGDSGVAGNWNGSVWAFESSGSTAVISGVACASGSLCKAVGVNGRIQSWNGTSWSSEEPTGDIALSPLYAIDCASATSCKAVGSTKVVSWNGSSWTPDSVPSGVLRAVSCPSATLCKAVGFAGVIHSWDGASWAAETSGTTQNLNGVACPSTTFCKAVGDSGVILSWDGSAWSADTSGTSSFFYAVSCPSTTLCKAVGSFGATRSWNGSAWSADPTGVAQNHLGVSCASPTLCKAVTSAGQIRSWDGTTWTYDASPTAAELRTVDCSSASRCKAVGGGGVIVSFDGASWSNDVSPSANGLDGVACAPSSAQCIAVGAVTTIIGTNLEIVPPTATITPTHTPISTSTSTPTSTPTTPPSQQGPNFQVNSAADTSDGACDLLGQGSGNQDCTLREAIDAANSNADFSVVTFAIPAGAGCTGANACSVQLGSMLPVVTNPLSIDGAANAGRITVDGGNGEGGGVRILQAAGSAGFLGLNGLNLVDGSSSFGSAIDSSFVELAIANCTFANNYASGGAGAIRASNRPFLVVNSTFDNNKGTVAGAIQQGGFGLGSQMTIVNSTFSQNSSTFIPSAGAATMYSNGAPVTLRNTLLVKPGASANGNCLGSGGGSFSADGFNFANDSTCGGATNSAAIVLDPLGDNGGPTLTMAPGAGSAAIDAGDPAVCAAAPVSSLDQRGYVRPAGAQCDAGAVESGSVPAATATPTGTPPDALTHTMTPTDTPTFVDTPTATATATPAPHDSVLLPVKPLTLKIRSGKTTVTKSIKVKVLNADILPGPEAGGHPIQLAVEQGECPPGLVNALPDFDKDTEGEQDTVLLAGGEAAKATVTVEVDAALFSTFNRKAPARCTMGLRVSSPNGDDPTPDNNFVPLEINVFDANDGEQSAVHESYVASMKALKITVRGGAATKTAKVKAGNADILPEPEEPGDLLTVTAADGDCPAGTLGVADYDKETDGSQNTVTVAGGKAKTGKLTVTAAAADFVSPNAKSPHRCIATIAVSGPGGDSDGSNDTTSLVVDVYDGNDY